MDWYAENILSVTGEYYGVEKTIEKEFTVFVKQDSRGPWLVRDMIARDAETDGLNGFTVLEDARGVDTFVIGSSTYAIVASYGDNGVQLIDVSDPTAIVALDAETDSVTFPELGGAMDVDTFTIGSSTYAIVASFSDSGVQLIDISNPAVIVARDSHDDGDTPVSTKCKELQAANGVDTFTIDSGTYAIVAAFVDDGVQLIDISDPAAIDCTGQKTDEGTRELDGATNVDAFTIGSGKYVIVASHIDHGVQIIDVSDAGTTRIKDAETDGENGFTRLLYTHGVDTFTIGSSTYAIVVGTDGVQTIDISDINNMVAMDAETRGENGFTVLEYARDVDTFTCGSRTYAIVVSNIDDGVQLIDISDPSNIVAIDAQTDGVNGFTELDGAYGVDTFTIDSSTYAIVTTRVDDGVQIIELPCRRS